MCRNCKTSQEAVDYVRARLTLKRDEEISQQDLITICEAVNLTSSYCATVNILI